MLKISTTYVSFVSKWTSFKKFTHILKNIMVRRTQLVIYQIIFINHWCHFCHHICWKVYDSISLASFYVDRGTMETSRGNWKLSPKVHFEKYKHSVTMQYRLPHNLSIVGSYKSAILTLFFLISFKWEGAFRNLSG